MTQANDMQTPTPRLELSPTVPEEELIPDDAVSDASMMSRMTEELEALEARDVADVTEESPAPAPLESPFVPGAVVDKRPLGNASIESGFADHRTYLYEGREIDQQFHLGVDLASLAHSPVPAANAGIVVFTGELGIYGRSVILDHGFGLFSTKMSFEDYGQMFHGDNERVDIESLVLSTQLWDAVARDLLS